MTIASQAYSANEELLNAITHMLGVCFSIAAAAVLITLAAVYADPWSIASCSIFGASMILMYTASSLYHSIPYAYGKSKAALKKLDHIAIYYLIAGSYTPFLLVSMRSATAWVLFGIIWGLTLAGTFLKILAGATGTKFWSISLYLAMGWLIIFASGKLFSALPVSGIVFLAIGGAMYTGGVLFYMKKRWKFSHAIWHMFVLAGTVMHFFAILFSCVLQ